jgi:hypothetical protein
MADCQKIPDCAFYNDRLSTMPGTAEFMKMVYCHQRFDECQRLQHSKDVSVNEADNITDPVGLNVSAQVQ